jgi:transposase
MLVVETIAKMRRLSLAQGKSIKAICRDLGVSRKVVRKVLRSGETEFRYERKKQAYPRMGAWREDLTRLLSVNACKPERERLTLIRIFEELRGLGYDGSYSSVWQHARAWEVERSSSLSEAYIPLSFAPGEACQFDWSHEIVLLNGVTTTVKVARMRLCHSRMFFVRAYPRESQEMVFDAHDRAFAFFRGACTRGIYDNMKTAVDKVFVGKERRFNRRFLQMCGHYLVEPEACTPAAGSRACRRYRCSSTFWRAAATLPRMLPCPFRKHSGSPRSRSPIAPATIASGGYVMERTQVLELMGTLKLYGMRSAYDEIMGVTIKRQHEPPKIAGDLLQAEIPRSRRALSNTSSPSPSCRWPRTSKTSTLLARPSTRLWFAISPAAHSSPISAISSWSAELARESHIWPSRSLAP